MSSHELNFNTRLNKFIHKSKLFDVKMNNIKNSFDNILSFSKKSIN
jgi:hypothetical protein